MNQDGAAAEKLHREGPAERFAADIRSVGRATREGVTLDLTRLQRLPGGWNYNLEEWAEQNGLILPWYGGPQTSIALQAGTVIAAGQAVRLISTDPLASAHDAEAWQVPMAVTPPLEVKLQPLMLFRPLALDPLRDGHSASYLLAERLRERFGDFVLQGHPSADETIRILTAFEVAEVGSVNAVLSFHVIRQEEERLLEQVNYWLEILESDQRRPDVSKALASLFQDVLEIKNQAASFGYAARIWEEHGTRCRLEREKRGSEIGAEIAGQRSAARADIWRTKADRLLLEGYNGGKIAIPISRSKLATWLSDSWKEEPIPTHDALLDYLKLLEGRGARAMRSPGSPALNRATGEFTPPVRNQVRKRPPGVPETSGAP